MRKYDGWFKSEMPSKILMRLRPLKNGEKALSEPDNSPFTEQEIKVLLDVLRAHCQPFHEILVNRLEEKLKNEQNTERGVA